MSIMYASAFSEYYDSRTIIIISDTDSHFLWDTITSLFFEEEDFHAQGIVC